MVSPIKRCISCPEPSDGSYQCLPMQKNPSDCCAEPLEVRLIELRPKCLTLSNGPGDASMTKLERLFAALALAVTIAVFVPNGAEAYSRWGYYSGAGQWGGWGW